MLQQIIVALIVLAAAWVVLRKYLPKPLRRHAAAVIASVARRAGAVRLSRWLETDLPAGSSCADGCGSCGNCATPQGSGGLPVTAAALAGTTGQRGTGDTTRFSITPEALRKTIRRH